MPAAEVILEAAEAMALSWLRTERTKVSRMQASAKVDSTMRMGGVGEVGVTFCVAPPDVAAEFVVGEVVQRFLVDHFVLLEEGKFVIAEPEVGNAFQQASRAAHHAIATAVRQPPGECFEH